MSGQHRTKSESIRSQHLKYLLGLLILLNLADGVLTHLLIDLGLGQEGNPFLLGIVGEPIFLIIKMMGVVFCAFLLWDIYRRFPKLALFSTTCFVTLYTTVVIWNSSLLLG